MRSRAAACGGRSDLRAVLTDLDRTLTDADLRVAPHALDAVDRLRACGYRVVLATGRPLDDLQEILPRFDGVVAENGAIVRAAGIERIDGRGFAARARAALGPVGRDVAWRTVVGSAPVGLAPYVRELLDDHAIPHALIRNADEVMILPPGVDKGSGAGHVLALLGVLPQAAVGVGDNDNDIALFRACGRGFAVANATRHAMHAADEVLPAGYADGFVALAERLLAAAPRTPRAR